MIAIIVPATPQRYTPLKKHATAFAQLNQPIAIICLAQGNEKWPEWHHCTFYSAGIFPAQKILGFAKLIYNNLKLLFKLKPDVIEAIDPPSLIAAATYRLFFPCILGYYSMEWFSQSASLSNHPIKRLIWTVVEKLSVKKADFAFTVNDTISRILSKQWEPTPVYTVRNLTTYRPVVDSIIPQESHLILRNLCHTQNPIFIYHGVIEDGRGLVPIINAFSELPHLHLAIIGYGPLEKKISELCKKFVNTSFLGSYSLSEVEVLLPQGWAGLVYIEPFSANQRCSLPGKLFDCVQAEIPVIGSPLPEIESHIHSHQLGLVVPDFSQESLYGAILKMSDPEFRNSFLIPLRKAKPILCWDEEQKKLLDPFEKMIRKLNGKRTRKPQKAS